MTWVFVVAVAARALQSLSLVAAPVVVVQEVLLGWRDVFSEAKCAYFHSDTAFLARRFYGCDLDSVLGFKVHCLILCWCSTHACRRLNVRI